MHYEVFVSFRLLYAQGYYKDNIQKYDTFYSKLQHIPAEQSTLFYAIIRVEFTGETWDVPWSGNLGSQVELDLDFLERIGVSFQTYVSEDDLLP